MPRTERFPWDTKNCVIAVALLPQKQKEIVYIGERNEVEKKIAGETVKLYVEEKRALGSFLFDCVDRFPDIRDFMFGLANFDNFLHKEALTAAEDCFYSGNLGKSFIAIRLWQQIRT